MATVLTEKVHAFEAASGRRIPYEIQARRPGDVAQVYADPSLAQRLLGWRTQLDVHAMCRDAWRWQSMNPTGYERAKSEVRARSGRKPPRTDRSSDAVL